MTFYIEDETGVCFSFPMQEVADQVMEAVLDMENCPYESQVNLVLTDNEGIHFYNKEYRGIDRPTDVLSFPNIDYDTPSDFSHVEEHEEDYFDPESGELLLGDMIISVEKIKEQAENYGHSQKREFAFLIAHSMLHLCGYDHMVPDEAAVMEQKQNQVLEKLGITREG